jgi:hypothetical protein
MAADVGLQKLWLFEGKRKKYFVFVRYKVQDNFCLTTYYPSKRLIIPPQNQLIFK